QFDRARNAAEEMAGIFDGRYYLEIQDNRLAKQEQVNGELKALGRRTGLPLVGTNDCHYLRAEDAAAHEVLLCIQTGKTFSDERRWKVQTSHLHGKDGAEMAQAFADVPEAGAHTAQGARPSQVRVQERRRLPVH